MSLFASNLAPKEFDEILIEPASKPTKVVWKFKGEIVRELKLTYSGANVEKVKVEK